MDTLLLARVQLGALTAFHLLFPAVTLAMGWLLLGVRVRAGIAPSSRLTRAFRIWMPVYALSVAFQVVSGWALWSQFNLNWPAFMEQARAVGLPLRLTYLSGTVLQVIPLAIVASACHTLSPRLKTTLVAVSAFGGVLSLLASVFLLSWMMDPVGRFDGQWQLSSADWFALIGNARGWVLAAQLSLASGITVGLLMAGAAVLRRKAGACHPDVDASAKFGLLLAAGSALATLELLVTTGDGMPDTRLIVAVSAVSVSASTLLLLLRRPETRLADLSPVLQNAMLVLPAAGWAVLLLSWPFDRMLRSAWLIRGQMRVDEAAAVLAPGTVNATLPVYLTTIAVLIVTYFTVLAIMALRSGWQDRQAGSMIARRMGRVV